ncbi:MAG: hypothetical protein LQ337_007632 [Flavoplaca oasis]|nr:MAG: hypothetical protein LQ337_007632 [Flavoplaca oasis]
MVLPYLGSDPAKLDADPHWALNRAAERGNLDALEAIITERRSDPDYPNLIADLDLPLETSARKCDLPMIAYLLDEGAIVSGRVISSAIHPFSGVMADALPVFKLFKENGWSVNALGVRGEPIFFSILPNETLVRWFLNNGIDITSLHGTCKSLTPVTHAAYCSTPAVISLLLSRGATLDYRVLQHAIRGHDDDDTAAFAMFDFLIDKDPSLAEAINTVDDLDHPSATRIQRTKLDFGAPLHWAVLTGKKSRVEFLLQKGADAGVRTPKKGQIPADWAKILGNQDLVDYLEACNA